MINSDPDGRELIITNNFIRDGLCHEDRWEVFFQHVVTKYQGHVYIHWQSVYPWIKEMAFRGDDAWRARDFINLWEKDVIRSIPIECGDAELPAIKAFRDNFQPRVRVIVGTVDEWLQLREDFSKEELAY